MARYSRYVAIGDSQTEGLWDVDNTVGLMGFADRLAVTINSHYPGLRYANLAVRGRRIRHLLENQLPDALAMRPDLITICIGMNDVTRPGPYFGRALADLDLVHEKLAQSGATIATTTFPDLTAILPVGRLIASRLAQINATIRAAADRHGFALVDLESAPSMSDIDTWSADRVHGSTKGHILFAAAAAEALGLPGSSHDWARADGAAPTQSLTAQAYSQVLWTQNMLMPWMWRHVRGLSSGHGITPRRPRLESVAG